MLTALVSLLLASTPAPSALDYDALASSMESALRAHYEHLHAHPELGKKETATAAYIRSKLASFGYELISPPEALPTAVIAVFDSGSPGATTCLRAEIDARPQQEATSLSYASQTPGVMHSCGHDAHTAILLGIAQLLPSLKSSLHGKVVLLFQPAEETAGGADDVVASGLLTQLGVRSMLALHVAPGLPVGALQVSPGPILAASSYFTVTVQGKESHAAAPFEGSDIPQCTAQLAAELPTFLARKLDILWHPTLVSVTRVDVGNDKASNVLVGEGTIKGTIRSFDDIDASVAGGRSIRGLVEYYATTTAARCGASAQLEIRKGPPATVNNSTLYSRLLPSLQSNWPGQIDAQPRGMFAEDFAFYTDVIPCLYLSLGIAKDTLGAVPVHNSMFTVHPMALREGVKALLILASAANE
ncbi:MAG: M20 family metallopeptidase [Acidobacteriota bacterium]